LRGAVDQVDPAIRLGLMTAETAYSVYGFAEWNTALAGARRLPVKWRPGGGFYDDGAPGALLGKMQVVGRQVSLVPAGEVDVQYEHENLPYQVLRKSSTIFKVEILAAVGVGCTGVALNSLGMAGEPLTEFLPWLDGVAAIRPGIAKAVATFGRSPCRGLWAAWNRDHQAAMGLGDDWLKSPMWGGQLGTCNELAEIGLPLAYTLASAAVCLLSGDGVSQFADAELRELFAGAVMMDGPALARLHERGLGALAGFALRGPRERDSIERFTGDPLNLDLAGRQRDCRPSFWQEKTWILDPQPGARVTAEVIDFTPTVHGACAGVFENALGGRVAVLGYYPWRMLHTLAKTRQMKALVRWLTRDRLPALVESYAKVALWCRNDAQGRPALLALNASLDAQRDLALLVGGLGPEARLIGNDGAERRILSQGRDGAYERFVVPQLAPWDAVVLAA
jgi:hypothetical protein